jgi:uncharacterized membrane-anchored protein YitT (DUF2179 family)
MENGKIVWNPINLLQIIIGCSMAVFAMKSFMIQNKFLDGGITGISLPLHEAININISLLVIVLNLPLIYMGYRRIGKTFAVQTIIAVILLVIGLQFTHINPITNDKLLIAVFGGLLIGTGIGLVIRAGGVIDGAEVVAVFTRRKIGFSNSEIVMIFNSFIFIGAGFHFGLESAMYSIITYFAATRATDYVVDGIEHYTAINIISSEQEKMKDLLINELSKGITVYKGERGYLPGSFDIKTDCEIITTIVSRLEVNQIQESIIKTDPKAFIYVLTIKDAAGGILKAKPHAK